MWVITRAMFIDKSGKKGYNIEGLGEVSASTLRRTYAQTVWKKTSDLSQVASALRHTRLKSTIRYITSLLEDTSEI